LLAFIIFFQLRDLRADGRNILHRDGKSTRLATTLDFDGEYFWNAARC